MPELENALYVVALPLGNKDDMTSRALLVLRACQVIAAEDTRKALQMIGDHELDLSKKKLLSLHEHNESDRVPELLKHLSAGHAIALISDAGTPLISDPGYVLVNAVLQAGFAVKSIPGACALIAALTVSGMPTDRFFFAGFLPPKGQAKEKALITLCDKDCTVVLYESPRRILNTLEIIAHAVSPHREVVVARELTKRWETVYRGEVQQVIAQVRADAYGEKGECVLVIKGAQVSNRTSLDADALIRRLANELPPNTVAKIASDLCGGNKQEHYRRLLAIKEQ